MHKTLQSTGILILAIAVCLSWAMVFPWARQGWMGDAIWLAINLGLFVILHAASGLFRRVLVGLALFSVLSACLVLVWPFLPWLRHSVAWVSQTVFSTHLRLNEAHLFLSAFVLLNIVMVCVSPVRRLVLGGKSR
ncbi:hypothetical protein NQT62_00440 [Limnobacter humi]|uniref:Transmembrane protein n=1 Tax=Limnobacter humi TaxID=1778671 RepID=A0ABT1WBL7_9BURK|nr:hypothetical protein [Limnobacter humi]MCQ8894905.1 hypothetical protein [Limnobacter humi]